MREIEQPFEFSDIDERQDTKYYFIKMCNVSMNRSVNIHFIWLTILDIYSALDHTHTPLVDSSVMSSS